VLFYFFNLVSRNHAVGNSSGERISPSERIALEDQFDRIVLTRIFLHQTVRKFNCMVLAQRVVAAFFAILKRLCLHRMIEKLRLLDHLKAIPLKTVKNSSFI